MCPARAARRASPRSSSCRRTRRRSGRARRRSPPINAAGEHLEDYPDGAAPELREAIGRAFGLDPARIVCGAGSDDLLNLLARAYLADGDEAIYTDARLPDLPDRDARRRRQAGGRAGEELHRRCRRDPGSGDAEDQDRLPRQSEQSDRHLPAVRRDQAPARAACRRMCCWCSTRPMPNTSARNDYEAGIELVATSENVVMTRTFSKIHGLAGAAARLDVWRRRMWSTRSTASAARSTSTRRRSPPASPRSRTPRIRSARARTTRSWLAWLTEEIGKLGLKVTPSVANFVLIHFPDDEGPHRGRRRRLPDEARADPAPGRRLRAAECAAHDDRHRGGEPAGGGGARRVPGRSRRERRSRSSTASR